MTVAPPTEENVKRKPLVLACVFFLVFLVSASLGAPTVLAGSFDARRIGMGGVVLSDYSEAQNRNVAFRAVPRGELHGSIPLPLGIVQVLASPPELNPDNDAFNPFEIAELATNFPVFLRLKSPDIIEDDIVIDIARNRLRMDLGDISEVVPEEPFELGGLLDHPAGSFSVKGFFAGLSPLVAVESDLELSPTLERALREGQDFLPNTAYSLKGSGEAQAALALGFGYARRINAILDDGKDPRRSDDLAIYAGGRFKYLMGFAYANSKPLISFTTPDTIFGEDPLDVDFTNVSTTSVPDESAIPGRGTGLDIGAAAFMAGYEVGLGVTNMATKIHWDADRELAVIDDSTDEVETYTIAENFDYTSKVPAIIVFNAAKRWAGMTLAFDIEKGVTRTTFHAGFELPVRNVAARTGMWLDPNGKMQFSGGAGVHLWKIGMDLALFTSSSVLTGDRAVDLAVSFRL